MARALNRYAQIVERIFRARHRPGDTEVLFERGDMEEVAADLGIELPKNLGDVIYSFRYRAELPESVREAAPADQEWVIFPAGRARYRFQAVKQALIVPNEALAETKVPDATPGVIDLYALTDEQALLAKLLYNRLLDVFTGLACYRLQSHLRTTVPDMGQVETDEVYVGIDRRGAHHVLPVQAKGGNDALSVVQIAQDYGLCEDRFPNLVARPVAAQFVEADLIALFAFERDREGAIGVSEERHYRLAPPEDLDAEDLETYRQRPE